MAYCFTEGCSCKGNPIVRPEDELEELKYWVQDVCHKADAFMEELEYGECDPIAFIKELQEELRKKTNAR